MEQTVYQSPKTAPPYLEDLVRRRTEELEAAIRENERINSALRESESRLQGLINQTLAGIAMIEDGQFTYVNPKLAEMFGYDAEEFLNLDPLDIAAESDRQKFSEHIDRRLNGSGDHESYIFRGLQKQGATIDVECHSSISQIGGRTVLINLMIDVTERVRAENKVRALQEQLQTQAFRDPLTGLYNRFPLNDVFDQEIRLAERCNGMVSVIMADIDSFKSVNDTFGHMAGDETLRVFSGLIQATFRHSDIHCRYGGDEFFIVLPGMTHQDAYERTEHLRKALQATEIAYGLHVTATFGIASYPLHGRLRDSLFAAADRALYAGKRSGGNRVVIYQEAHAEEPLRTAAYEPNSHRCRLRKIRQERSDSTPLLNFAESSI